MANTYGPVVDRRTQVRGCNADSRACGAQKRVSWQHFKIRRRHTSTNMKRALFDSSSHLTAAIRSPLRCTPKYSVFGPWFSPMNPFLLSEPFFSTGHHTPHFSPCIAKLMALSISQHSVWSISHIHIPSSSCRLPSSIWRFRDSVKRGKIPL